MKLLLDSCVWGKAKAELERAGHNVVWCGERENDPGDDEILAHAYSEQRVLVTLDKDFGELAILSGYAHCGILRLVDISAKSQAKLCQHALDLHSAVLLDGGIVTVEPGRIRIRPAEQE